MRSCWLRRRETSIVSCACARRADRSASPSRATVAESSSPSSGPQSEVSTRGIDTRDSEGARTGATRKCAGRGGDLGGEDAEDEPEAAAIGRQKKWHFLVVVVVVEWPSSPTCGRGAARSSRTSVARKSASTPPPCKRARIPPIDDATGRRTRPGPGVARRRRAARSTTLSPIAAVARPCTRARVPSVPRRSCEDASFCCEFTGRCARFASSPLCERAGTRRLRGRGRAAPRR